MYVNSGEMVRPTAFAPFAFECLCWHIDVIKIILLSDNVNRLRAGSWPRGKFVTFEGCQDFLDRAALHAMGVSSPTRLIGHSPIWAGRPRGEKTRLSE
jgi:hypothetical protein